MPEATPVLQPSAISLWLILLLASPIIIGLIIAAVVIARKMKVVRNREDQASELFERSILDQYGGASQTQSAPCQSCAPVETLPPLAAVSVSSLLSPASPSAGETPSGQAIEPKEVLRRLEGIGQVAGLEGSVAVCGGNAKGVIFRFTNRKLGLILPQPDSNEAMAKYIKSYNQVFTILPGGEVSVSCRMADFVSKMIDFK